jgi:predicted DNA-binding protein (MmcQ/YjbR family)
MPKESHIAAKAELLKFALSLPEAYEDHPWDETVAKVNQKVFVFFGMANADTAVVFTVKLPQSLNGALVLPFVKPAGYNLGKSGWVTVTFTDDDPPVSMFLDWIKESYRAVAPKKLVAVLDQPK